MIGLQASYVEQLAIKAVSDWKAIITVLKSIRKHGGEYHAEQSRCQYKPCLTPFVVQETVQSTLHRFGPV